MFEHIPNLRVVLVEGGFAWLPALSWRLDKHYKRLREEVPHLKRLPSEYIRDNIWVTTQPIEEPERPEDLLATCEWIGWDRMMFSTDYPHWDQDDPRYAFKVPLPEQGEADDVPRQRAVVLRPGRLSAAWRGTSSRPSARSRRAAARSSPSPGREIGIFNVKDESLRADQPLPA